MLSLTIARKRKALALWSTFPHLCMRN